LHFQTNISSAHDQMFVPLSMLKKVVARSFDASFGSGGELKVADSELNGHAMSEAIIASTRIELGAEPTAEFKAAVKAIVGGSRGEMTRRMALDLVVRGKACGHTVISASSPGFLTRRLIEDCADNYLLAALVSPRRAGAHEVMKYSAHWNPMSTEK